MLAALGTVDWVGINRTSSAEPILDTVRPDIYVKGSDYENPEDDVTGKIATEREARRTPWRRASSSRAT